MFSGQNLREKLCYERAAEVVQDTYTGQPIATKSVAEALGARYTNANMALRIAVRHGLLTHTRYGGWSPTESVKTVN